MNANLINPFAGQNTQRKCFRLLYARIGQTLAAFALALAMPLSSNGEETYVFETLHEFVRPPSHPQGRLIQGSDGSFYGISASGGAYQLGTIFKVDSDGQWTILSHVDDATPGGFADGLVAGPDDAFYGTTTLGGAHDKGTVVRVTPTGVMTVIAEFSGPNGARPQGLLRADDGNFYGVTEFGGDHDAGTVFVVTAAGELTTLAHFSNDDGRRPNPGMIQASDGDFYGTTHLGGTDDRGVIFKVTLEGELSVLVDLMSRIALTPNYGLVEGPDGNFYGSDDSGVIFKVTPAGVYGAIANLTEHGRPGHGLLVGADGNLFGVARGWGESPGFVFKVALDGSYSILADLSDREGAEPSGGLVQGADGALYGLTEDGGLSNSGTVFRVTPAGEFETLATFFSDEGIEPLAGLAVAEDGAAYGTASEGGANDVGILFRVGMDGTFVKLVDFSGETGNYPVGTLLRGSDGGWYGTTLSGGDFGHGTVYVFREGDGLSVLNHFDSLVEAFPWVRRTGLVQADDGNLYGTSHEWHAGMQGGALFRLTLAGEFQRLASFDGGEGIPAGRLLEAEPGTFFGMTKFPFGGGILFRADSTGDMETLVEFNNATSCGELVAGANGEIYGTARWPLPEGMTPPPGNSSSEGAVVFKYDSDGSLAAFGEFAEGDEPCVGFVSDDGFLFGTTRNGGSSGNGTVFRMTQAGEVETVIEFNGQNGSFPNPKLTEAPDGTLYGTTEAGGSGGGGAVFRVIRSRSDWRLGDFRADGGTASFDVTGTYQESFVVDTSTDLENWAPVSTHVLNGTSLRFTGAELGDDSARYFRVRKP